MRVFSICVCVRGRRAAAGRSSARSACRRPRRRRRGARLHAAASAATMIMTCSWRPPWLSIIRGNADRHAPSTRARSRCAESLNYREWSGYYAVSAYEAHHEHEYNAIRNASALIDVSPLFKYLRQRARRREARRSRHHARRVEARRRPGLLHAVVRRARQGDRRWDRDAAVARTRSAGPPPIRACAGSRRTRSASTCAIEDISEQVAALALQGPTSGRLLDAVADADIRGLKYFRMTRGTIAGVPVEISRTGYTGDLGYEIWMPWDRAIEVWDALMAGGRPFDIHPAGMLALDVARVEAGLLLIDVDFHSSKKALIEAQKYSPFEMGLGRLVQLDKRAVRRPRRARRGAAARSGAADRRPRDQLAGGRGALRRPSACAPQVAATASRIAGAGLPRAAARWAARRPRRGRRC